MTETETVPESLSNDVFISYRRDVGGILAMALYQQLTDKGVNAFYDIESIRAGRFDVIILNQVAGRPDFVLVLTPGTLERCARRMTGCAARSNRLGHRSHDRARLHPKLQLR